MGSNIDVYSMAWGSGNRFNLRHFQHKYKEMIISTGASLVHTTCFEWICLLIHGLGDIVSILLLDLACADSRWQACPYDEDCCLHWWFCSQSVTVVRGCGECPNTVAAARVCSEEVSLWDIQQQILITVPWGGHEGFIKRISDTDIFCLFF